jgi:sugar transferase (PEP-CTERM/EpsH1 system associated)
LRVLILDEEFPYPLNSGKRIRSFKLNSRLTREHEVRWLAWGEPGDRACRHFAQAGIQPIAVPRVAPPRSGPGFYLRLGLNLLSPDPYIVTSHYGRAMQEAFDRQLREFQPDVVLCEWTPYAAYLRRRAACPFVLIAHNIEGRIWRRYQEHETNPAKRWYIARQAEKVERFEREVVNMVSGVTTVSEEERQFYQRLAPELPSMVVDNGVDLGYFHPMDSMVKPLELVFSGSMDWRPNQDAARHFVHDIFPRIRSANPRVTVTFVGRNPPQEVVALGQTPGVTVTGTVEDVRPYLDRAAMVVVPLRIGGGTRLKILEALAMNKAVVSTSVGAEGLHVSDGRDIVIADGVKPFADAVLGLLEQPKRAQQIGITGRTSVEARYGWDYLAGKLSDFLHEVVERR